MATITPSTGLISGLDIKGIVDQLIAVEGIAISKLQNRQKAFQATQTGFNALSANLVTLSSSASQLAQTATFQKFKATSSDTAQLVANARHGVQAGQYELQALRMTTTQKALSRGFANRDEQTIGTAGSITIASGGQVASETTLDTLNAGAGVRRGVIRITDRSGASADVDLTKAFTVSDVIDTINQTAGISVSAIARGDHIEIRDTSGQSTTNLTVADRTGGHTAEDLGLKQSVAASTLTGTTVYQVTSAFALSHLNDRNGLRLIDNLPDLRITLSDVAGTVLDVDLNGAVSVGDVINKINNHTGNAGKVTASLQQGRLQLTDNTGGGGTSSFAVAELNGSSVLNGLGLTSAAVGNTITGGALASGINSVLLRNLRGGDGIDQLGSISLTDRAGLTATVDLSQAQSLDDVIQAINTAQTTGGQALHLTASLNAAGTGIRISDTSGSTASNLTISDLGGSTLATQLGLAQDVAASSIDSGHLHLQYVTEATRLTGYAPGNSAVRSGTFSIIDSSNQQHFISVDDTIKNLGDLFNRISVVTAGKVTAQLNATGDGFKLIDNAGGAGQLQINEQGGNTAADLRLLGTGTTGTDGKSFVNSRVVTTVDILATDTLTAITSKLNAAKAGVTAAIVSDGSSFTPHRLEITSKSTGSAGRFFIDDGGLGLGLTERVRGRDALLRVGSDPAQAFILSSSTNRFLAAVPGLAVDIRTLGSSPAVIDVTQDTTRIVDSVRAFVNGYNDLIKKTKDLTKFDSTTNSRGVLQGESLVVRMQSTFNDILVGDRFGSKDSQFRSLASLGISLAADGTLDFDSLELTDAIAEDAEGVKEFFTHATTGIADKLKKTVESFTDPLTGKITLQTNSLQASVDTLDKRITSVSAILEGRRERLLAKFYHLETVLASLNSQQAAVSKLRSVTTTSSS